MKPKTKPGKGKVTNQIRRIRLARSELTQAELAEKVGATRQTIIAIEAGKYAPSMELAFRIVQEFGVSFEDVFQFTQDK
ncbi:MAG: helix-turn-helix transcriptional regulator [Robiginitomaculum sp.]|jgi:putative transcriptional regulator|nr:helix-turn-helix transcriptional regulator [Robiginitomaculum sp.]